MHTNDLVDFINSASNQMDEEYYRIRKRTNQDPGTAGDQGEENWATLLRQWLPPIFQIVTKGRIIDSNGNASPQVDIIVLKPEYPKGLLDKKLYLAGGVLAVFECKLTLRSGDLKKFFKNSTIIKKMLPPNSYFSIYDEAQSPLYFGLLAHSHNRAKTSKTIDNLGSSIFNTDVEIIKKPIEMPDLICIADTGCWVTTKYLAPQINIEKSKPIKSISTFYVCEQNSKDNNVKPIGTAIKAMMLKLSKEHPGLSSLAKYFQRTFQETGGGPGRYWAIKDVFSEENQKQFNKIGKHPNYYFPDDWKYLR